MSPRGPGPAGYWHRHAAWTLDALLVALPVLPFAAQVLLAQWPLVLGALERLSALLAAALVAGVQSGEAPLALVARISGDPAFEAAVDVLRQAAWDALAVPLVAFVALAALYWPAFEGSPWQATPGKRALGLVVCTAGDARAPGRGRAVARHAAGIASWLSGNLGHALAALPPHKRALHDRLAGTRVLQQVSGTALPGWARTWLFAQMLAAAAMAWWAASGLSGVMRDAVANALAA